MNLFEFQNNFKTKIGFSNRSNRNRFSLEVVRLSSDDVSSHILHHSMIQVVIKFVVFVCANLQLLEIIDCLFELQHRNLETWIDHSHVFALWTYQNDELDVPVVSCTYLPGPSGFHLTSCKTRAVLSASAMANGVCKQLPEWSLHLQNCVWLFAGP